LSWRRRRAPCRSIQCDTFDWNTCALRYGAACCSMLHSMLQFVARMSHHTFDWNTCNVSKVQSQMLELYLKSEITATLQHPATPCNTLQHTATHCNTLQHTATHCDTLQHTATHYSTLQHTATHCNALQHTATHCNTLQHTATHCDILRHTATHCVSKSQKSDARAIHRIMCIYIYIHMYVYTFMYI